MLLIVLFDLLTVPIFFLFLLGEFSVRCSSLLRTVLDSSQNHCKVESLKCVAEHYYFVPVTESVFR